MNFDNALKSKSLNNLLSKNCFELFDLPIEYVVDKETLLNRYRALQKEIHPDKFINHPDQLLSVMVSAHINHAYTTLSSPLLRSISLLEQNGIELNLDNEKQLPPEFLLTQMELHEEIEDAKQDIDSLNNIASKLILTTTQLEVDIQQNFADKNYTKVIELIQKMAFYNKLENLVNTKIEELW